MKKSVIGILAHVDAGKTTLAEAIMYTTGKIRKLGRVDHGNTTMDTDTIERERGITIFTSQAVFNFGELEATLLDTPGHVDFSAETERTLQVLDYAILVISGTDGVQAHTRTLWQLLSIYNIPVFIFVTKMDFSRKTSDEIISELKKELGTGFIDFTDINVPEVIEEIALTREDILETYMEKGRVSNEKISELIASRAVFPCYFGSGLKLAGIDEFLSGLDNYIGVKEYPEVFGAKVFKISHDSSGNRITHMKVTGGILKVRDSIIIGDCEEKVSQIRIFSGAKYENVGAVSAGNVCAVVGLSNTRTGQGLGFEAASSSPILEPVMTYRINLPSDCDSRTMLTKLHLLEEEDPMLHVSWNEHLQEIHVGLMGEVQTEILKSIIYERFNTEVSIDSGRVMYKETIGNVVEGVGHYEPLRHYAEVHLLLEPLSRGTGLVFDSKCSEDLLDKNWQRLILTHLSEKQHVGVATGSPITDVKITLMSGRAHLKHTEGGDFRQATYRAVRQGLMQADTILLEPYYTFKIEVPPEQIGRVINDIRMKSGTFDSPEPSGTMTLIKGRAPVTELSGYAAELAAFTSGRGRIIIEPAGYDECHNTEKILAETVYEPENDIDNSPDSVFCAHGAGYTVKWNKVPEYMHLESCLKSKSEATIPKLNQGNLYIDDKELEAIMEREFGPIKRPLYTSRVAKAEIHDTDFYANLNRTRWFIVDGYNVIFAWNRLKSLSDNDMDAARSELINTLINYSSFTKHKVVLVFDAYKVVGNTGKRFDTGGIHIAFTKENETADMYIEKLLSDIGKNEQVRVVTSDNLIRLSAVRSGVLRISALEFEEDVSRAEAEMHRVMASFNKTTGESIEDKIALKNGE